MSSILRFSRGTRLSSNDFVRHSTIVDEFWEILQKQYVATGGVQVAGLASLSKVKCSLPNGGIQHGGSAMLSKTKTFLTAGGLNSYGSAVTSLIHLFIYATGGGIQYSGAASLLKSKAFLSSGGLQSSGNGLVQKMKSFTASGGVHSGGNASFSKLKSFLASGGTWIDGSALSSHIHIFTCFVNGGIQYAGTAPIARIKAFICDGGISYDGYGDYELIIKSGEEYQYNGTGGIGIDGEAVVSKLKSFLATGGIQSLGEGVSIFIPGIREFIFIPSGGISVGGKAFSRIGFFIKLSYSADIIQTIEAIAFMQNSIAREAEILGEFRLERETTILDELPSASCSVVTDINRDGIIADKYSLITTMKMDIPKVITITMD